MESETNHQLRWKHLRDPERAAHYNIFAHLRPQVEERRFDRTDEEFRSKLRCALNALSSNDSRHISRSSSSTTLPAPPQTSRVILEDDFIPSFRVSRDSLPENEIPEPKRKFLKVPLPETAGVAPRRSFYQRKKRYFIHRLARRHNTAKHHLLFHRYDHREYDRDVHRGVRGRGLLSGSELNFLSESSDSGSDFIDSDPESRRSISLRPIGETSEPNETKIETAELFDFNKDRMDCATHYLRQRTLNYLPPKEALQHKLRHLIQNYVQNSEQMWKAKGSVRPPMENAVQVNCPARLLETVWAYKKFWPTYRMKTKFAILKAHPKQKHPRLKVRGHAIRRRDGSRWQPDDPLHHRYDTLTGCHLRCGPRRYGSSNNHLGNHVRDHLPRLNRHSRSLTDLVVHLLHADKAFTYLYERVPPPSVAVGGMNFPLDEDFIRKVLGIIQQEPRFAQWTASPDRAAITTVKVVSYALPNGLVEALKLLETEPAEVLGADWHVRLTRKPGENRDLTVKIRKEIEALMNVAFNAKKTSFEFLSDGQNLPAGTSGPTMSVIEKIIMPCGNVGKLGLSGKGGSDWRREKGVSESENWDLTREEMMSGTAGNLEGVVSGRWLSGQRMLDRRFDEVPGVSDSWLNEDGIVVGGTSSLMSMGSDEGDEEKIIPRSPLDRQAFLDAKAAVETRRRLRQISRILCMAKQNDVFGKIVSRRLLINSRRSAQVEAHARRLQYADSSAEFAARPGSAPPFRPHHKKHHKKRKRPHHKRPHSASGYSKSSLKPQSGLSSKKRMRRVKPFRRVEVTRTGRAEYYLPFSAIERTKMIERRHERLRKRFYQPLQKCLSGEPKRNRSFGCPEFSGAKERDAQRITVDELVDAFRKDGKVVDVWRGLRYTLKCWPYDARAFINRADFEKDYDYAMGDIRTSVDYTGYTTMSALAFACICYHKNQLFRALSYFVLAIQLTPVKTDNAVLRIQMYRALAILLFRTQQYTLALDVWIEASVIASSPDPVFFLFAARKTLEDIDTVELFFSPKLMMFSARLFWTTHRYAESFECITQCRLVKQYVHPAVRGIDCSDRAVTFLEILCNVRRQDNERAYLLAQKGCQRWETDIRFLTWFAFIKYHHTAKWRRRPWATYLIHRLCRLSPDNHFVWYAEARCRFYSQRNPRQALSCLMHVIKLAPKFYEAYFFRSTLRRILGAYRPALRDIRLCCDVYPRRALCWATFGYLALLVHRYQTALSCFMLTSSLKHRSKFNWIFLLRGWIFFKWEYFECAFEDFFLLLRRNPINPYVLKAVALTAWRHKGQKFVESLLAKYQRLLLPAFPAVWIVFGLSRFVQADKSTYARAVHVLQEVVHTHPLYPLARFNLGVALYWCLRPADAVIMFEALHDPERDERKERVMDELLRIHAYAGLGICLFLTSQHARSLGILESIANTGFADSYFYLAFGFIRMVMKKPREAAMAFSKASHLEGHNSEIKLIVAAIYMLYNCIKKAITFYDKLVCGEDVHYARLALLNRAYGLAKLEDYPAAARDLKTLNEHHPDFAASYQMQIESLALDVKIKGRRKLLATNALPQHKLMRHPTLS
ncbi:hypothetical protein BV898_05557 [Hypsibius exemplaris]|uniref:Uncharacterized protein n=1 Tax=Hypsibius exemplaris TaxID=2072580 RepID=A0A1W0WZ93_HYPEX|nr:hypothetical protein BV898_05557 [Hypsibius exemplaris]